MRLCFPPQRPTDAPRRSRRYKKLVEAHKNYVSAIDDTGEAFFDVIFIDGRAHGSAAIKAAGYLRNSSLLFINDWPKKFASLGKRDFIGLSTIGLPPRGVRTVRRQRRRRDPTPRAGPNGEACDSGRAVANCLAVLRVKPQYAGVKATHDAHTTRFKNFMRSPMNF